MGLIPALNSAVTGTIISSSDYNSNMDTIRDTFNTYAVLIDTAKTITAQHTFAPASAQAPFVLGANAQGQLVTGLNADQLDSQEGSFYRDASNLNAGTIPDARLPSEVLHTDQAKTVTATLTFSHGTVSTAPFAVAGNSVGVLVSGLNADELDGQDGSFYQNAGNLNAGTLPSARVSGAYTGITAVGTLTSLTVSGNVMPSADSLHDLGSTTVRWANIYADNVDIGSGVTVDTLQVGATNGATITGILSTTTVWDIPETTDGSSQTTTVTVTGAAVGDLVHVEIADGGGRSVGSELYGYVSAPDTVTLSWTNQFGNTINPTSATYRIIVFKF